MLMNPELLQFLQDMQVQHPLPRDPNDLAAYVERYDAVSRALPAPVEPPTISAGSRSCLKDPTKDAVARSAAF